MQRSNLDNWIDAAKIYAEWKGENIYSCFCKAFAEKLFADINHLSVLDAGCGDGEYTELFRQNGANAVGCDGSNVVIEIAKKQYPLCQFDVVDLSDTLPYNDGQFNLVFSNLVLMDIDSIHTVIKEISRVLAKKGKMFFSIVHPAFYLADWARNNEGIIISKNVTGYISCRETEMVWETQPVIHYHRPISFYFNMLAENGLGLTKMYEPIVYEDSKIPDIPLYLFAEFVKD